MSRISQLGAQKLGMISAEQKTQKLALRCTRASLVLLGDLGDLGDLGGICPRFKVEED